MFSAGLRMVPSHLMYFRDKPLLGNLADVFRTKILEIEKSSLIRNIKLILQYKELNSDPIRGWRT